MGEREREEGACMSRAVEEEDDEEEEDDDEEDGLVSEEEAEAGADEEDEDDDDAEEAESERRSSAASERMRVGCFFSASQKMKRSSSPAVANSVVRLGWVAVAARMPLPWPLSRRV